MKNIIEKLSPGDYVLRADGLVTADLDGEIGMMHIEKGMYYGFDTVGTRIWELIEKPNTVENIITALREEYDIDDTTCREDVNEFLQLLHKKELININEVRKV